MERVAGVTATALSQLQGSFRTNLRNLRNEPTLRATAHHQTKHYLCQKTHLTKKSILANLCPPPPPPPSPLSRID